MKRLIAGGFAILAAGCSELSGAADSVTAEQPVTSVGTGTLPTCDPGDGGFDLPDAVRETSGLAQGRRDPSVFWTHNDAGNGPELFALDAQGALLGTTRVEGADAIDWEDIESAPCAAGDCLYIADTGDNEGERDFVTVYRVPEPDARSADPAHATAFPARFPEGKWDVEALFVLPGSGIYLVTKGRRGPIVLYRHPGTDSNLVELQSVRELLPAPSDRADRVTGATAAPDGRWIAVTTLRTLYLYPAAALVSGLEVEPVSIDITELGHVQSEAVAITPEGTVWLTSEAENRENKPRMSNLRCTFPAE